MPVRNDRITRGKLGDIEFQLNPTEIVHDDGAVWSEINSPGMARPITNYSYGRAGTYQFELYFNKKYYRSVDIPAVLTKIKQYRTSKSTVLFTYMGTTTKVVVLDCSIRIMSMNKNLVPTEVTISMTLKEIYD